MNKIKNKADYSGYHTLLQPENTVRKIPQPVKVAQLLRSSKQLQNGQKDSAIKISLPERITPYLKKASSQKKNVTNVCVKLPHTERNVRRNLKFSETPISAIKNKKFVKANTNNISDDPKKENYLSTRKSFLVPPNTIKELHIKNRFKRNRSELSQFRTLSMIPENINSRLSETLEDCSSQVENTHAHADVVHMKNKTSLTQNVSSQMFNVNEQSGINILHSSFLDLADTSSNAMEKISENLNANKISNVNICGSQNDDCNVTTNRSQLSSVGNTDIKIEGNLYSDNDIDQNNVQIKIQEHSDSNYTGYDSSTTCVLPDTDKIKETRLINVEKMRCSSTTTNIYGDLHSTLQTVKLISECLNLQSSTNEEQCALKTELTILSSKLKHLACRLVEVVSDITLTQTIITKVLSAIDAENMETKDNNENKIKQITEITDNIFRETCKTPGMSRSKCLETDGKNVPRIQLDQTYIASENNKENKEILSSPIVKQCKEFKSGTRRRSARLMAKVLDNLNVTNDSFVNLENELDINIKSNTPITPFTNRTPAKNKYKDKKIGRPLKEYMVLKSRLSCLLTPNIKRSNLSESKSDVCCETDGTKTVLSDKVLEELCNLYGDSF